MSKVTNVSSFPDVRMRNFRLQDELFFSLEAIAQIETRDNTTELVDKALWDYVNKWKKKNNVTDLHLSDSRQEKMYNKEEKV